MTRANPLLPALGSIALAACGTEPSVPPPAPDVVVLVVDTLRADHLSLYGHKGPTSPHLDALASESVTFEKAFAHSGWTLASTVSLLTGRYPSEHQAVRDPADPLRFGRLAPTTDSLATLLHGAGYATGAFVNNVYLAPEFGVAHGFDVYDYDGSSGLEERNGPATVARALHWLQAQTGPAFAYLHVMEPHVPYLPPAHLRRRFTGPGEPLVPTPFCDADTLHRLINRLWIPTPAQQDYIRAMYDEEILAADEAIGDLVAGLRTGGRDARTVLVVTADHGEEFWDHGGFEHGHSLYGEAIRVPLVIRGLDVPLPPRTDASGARVAPPALPSVRGTRAAFPVQHADVFQTLVAMAGVQPPGGSRGDDLRRLLADPTLQQASRPILSEDCLYGPPKVAVTVGDWRFIVNLDSKVAGVYHLDASGQSDDYVDDPATLERVGRPLYDALVGLRGDLEKRPLPTQTAAIDEENMEKLRALGYIR